MLGPKFAESLEDKTVVIKTGGEPIDKKALLRSMARDVAELHERHVRIIIVHGGKTQIDKRLEESGVRPERVNGLRVTDNETVSLIEDVYQEVAASLSDELEKLGVASSILPGHKGLLRARPIDESRPDLHLVGKVDSVEGGWLRDILNRGEVAVVSPLGRAKTNEEQKLNINADHAASAVAREMQAAVLSLLTNVGGVKDRSGTLLTEIRAADYDRLRKAGIVSDGMIPKIESALEALAGGVKLCRIANGMIPNPILNSLFELDGGTSVVA